MRNVPHITVTGLDGSGKNTVADAAVHWRSFNRPQVKISRPTEVVHRGEVFPIAPKLTKKTDSLHRRTTDSKSRLGVAAVNGLEMLAKARLIAGVAAKDHNAETVWWVRDKVVDLAVYSGFYLERFGRIDTEHVTRLFRVASGEPSDVLFYLHVSPEVAVDRIQGRIGEERASDMHESPEHLAMLGDRYQKVFDVARRLYGTQVVQIDVDSRTQEETAEIVTHYTTVALNGGRLPADLL